MQEVLAIIRVNRMQRTKEALSDIGLFAMTATRVLGRGKQRGLHYEINSDAPEKLNGEGHMQYVPKRMLWMVVRSGEVDRVVDAIIKANQTGKIGDGKIFVSPVEDAIRVRTGEQGEAAIL